MGAARTFSRTSTPSDDDDFRNSPAPTFDDDPLDESSPPSARAADARTVSYSSSGPAKQTDRATKADAPGALVVRMAPGKLKPHPLNKKLYEDRPDPAFEESIAKRGIMQSIVATKENTILSGHRRWAAAVKLKLDLIPVEIRDVENEAIAIIELNRYREKTNGEIYEESRALKAELAKLAAERMKSGKSADGSAGGRGKKSNAGHDRGQGSDELEKRQRKTQTKVAKAVGTNREKLRKLEAVLESEHLDDDTKARVRRNETSLERGYREAKKLEKAAEREERRKNQPQVSDQFEPRVIMGDCTVKLAELENESVHLVITDPPYAISGANRMTMKGDRVENAEFGKWDELSYEDYLKLAQKSMREIERVLVQGGSLYWFTDRLLISDCWSVASKCGLTPRNVMTWGKTNPSPNTRGNFASATEMFIYCVSIRTANHTG